MRVDLEFFKKVEDISEKNKVPMTEITRQMIPTSSLIRSFNPLEAFSVFKPELRKKL
jgi:hypothetical protein